MSEKKPTDSIGPSLELQLFTQWHEEFSGESDRAAVILGAAKLDLSLRELLVGRLLPNASGQDELFDTDKPISTFSARINVAYRLGLIDKQFSNLLHLVRRIRNDFAHEAVGAELGAGSHRDRVRLLAAPFLKKKQFETFAANQYSAHSEASRCFRLVLTILVVRLQLATEAIKVVDETAAVGVMPIAWKD